MAVLASIATGNWTAAATWGVVDATSYLNAENATESLLTTAYSGTRSVVFTPGAITVSHLGVKLCERIGTTGTISVSLRNATIGLDDFVTGTEVTINTADLPSCVETDANGGWILFKLASPVLLLAATNYNIQAKTSSATMVDLWTDGTADNLSRALVTTTTQAPVAGDDLIVAGEMTGAGTSNAFVVTMDETATTDYGSASTSLVTPAIAVCNLGILRNGIAASTTYNLKVSGCLIIYAGGEFDLGTVATAMPRNSSVVLLFDCAANVDFGLVVRNGGTFIAQGLSRTVSKVIDRCLLNTDEAAAQTVLGVDTDTGWLDTDEIVIASTTRTGSQTELRTLSGAAGASSVTVTAGLTNAHSGTSPTQAEVILLTRNVRIQGASASLQSYVDIKPTATVDCDWTEFKWLGSATANKRGIDVATTTGSLNFNYCSLHDFVVASSVGFFVQSPFSDNITCENVVSYNTSNSAFSMAATAGTAWTINNWIAMGNPGTNAVFTFGDVGGTITNISAVGNSSTGTGIVIVETGGAAMGTINNLVAHSNGGTNISFSSFHSGNIGNITAWRGNSTGLLIASLQKVTLDTVTLFGNVTTNFLPQGGFKDVTVKSLVASGDTTFATTNGIAPLASSGGSITFENSTFGVVSGIKTAHTRDLVGTISAALDLFFHNCLLASTEIASQTLMPPGVVYGSQKHDQTAGLHKTYKREGTISIDTTAGLFDASPSVRMEPLIATEKLESPAFRSVVTSGNSLTVSVKVRESVVGDGTDYNGNRIRLLVKRNAAAGIAADTVLATATVASEGAFETISGTTAAVTDDAVLEFAVDCDGTTGWINYDTVAVTTQVPSQGLKYWQNGHPVAYGDNSAGGGGGVMGSRIFTGY